MKTMARKTRPVRVRIRLHRRNIFAWDDITNSNERESAHDWNVEQFQSAFTSIPLSCDPNLKWNMKIDMDLDRGGERQSAQGCKVISVTNTRNLLQ
jgi:hypothetical protein